MLEFNNEALNKLKECKNNIHHSIPSIKIGNIWGGAKTKEWFDYFETDWTLNNLNNNPIYRYDLLTTIDQIKKNKVFDIFIVREFIVKIFAWGGMTKQRNRGKLALAYIDRYEDICKDLLNGKLTNFTAYKHFFELHNHKNDNFKMKGIGPAFYTKLIFFLGNHDGLIMDQWTAKSVNLICNDKIIKFDGDTVSKRNNNKVYKAFIEIIKKLQIELAMDSLSETEALIFSTSRKVNKSELSSEKYLIASEWRNFVIENYK